MKFRFVFSCLLLILFSNTFSGNLYSQTDYYPGGETYIILIDGTTRLYDPSIDYGSLNLKMPPVSTHRNTLPKGYIEKMKANNMATCSLDVTYNNFSAEAQAAFQYAVDIWQTTLNSSVPIKTYASWEPMGPGVLGSSTRQSSYRNFSGAPLTNVNYPGAMAEAISGVNLNGTGWEIFVRFNSDFSWYLGTDGNAGNQYDFVSTVLHELCHGVGFYSSFNYSGGYGSWGSSTGYPWVFDLTVENAAGGVLINTYTNNSIDLGTQITSNNIFYDNITAVANNGGNRVSIYAPTTWNGGSSMSHVGEIYNGTFNALMTYSGGPGDVEHTPGPIVIGMLKDMGWTIANIPPILISPIPDFRMAENSDEVFFIKMSDYFYDANVYRLTDYEMTSSGNVTAEILGDSLFLTASNGFTGLDTLYITVTDSASETTRDTVVVTVTTPQSAIGGIIYSTGTSSAGGLVQINASSGSVAEIGLTGFIDIKGLTVNPVSHELYGVFITSNYAKLLRIDASTGLAYEHRIIPGSSYRGIAFDNDGGLYIATTTGLLCRVDLNSGDTTSVGSTGISSLQCITVNPLTNQMWGLSLGGAIYKINKETSAQVQIGTTGFSSARYIAFDQSGRMYGLSGGTNQPFYSVDTTSGSGTLIGLTGKTGLSAMAIWGNTVGIDEGINENPNQFTLSQNYPNPFNPTTSIKYALGANAKVTLKIYNMLGQEVCTLVNGKAQVANKQYDVTWDGKDNSGHAVASGVYMYRLEAGSFVKTMKMLFVK